MTDTNRMATGRIAPIFKKGEKDDVRNSRGITLMDTGCKIYTEIKALSKTQMKLEKIKVDRRNLRSKKIV